MKLINRLRIFSTLLFAVIPFLFSSLFPSGLMPQVTENGFEVVLCSGEGPKTIILDLPFETEDKNSDNLECPWALTSVYTLAQIIALPGFDIQAFKIEFSGFGKSLIALQTQIRKFQIRAPPL